MLLSIIQGQQQPRQERVADRSAGGGEGGDISLWQHPRRQQQPDEPALVRGTAQELEAVV